MDNNEQRDKAEELYWQKFCLSCGTSPCEWDGEPDGFHTDADAAVPGVVTLKDGGVQNGIRVFLIDGASLARALRSGPGTVIRFAAPPGFHFEEHDGFTRLYPDEAADTTGDSE